MHRPESIYKNLRVKSHLPEKENQNRQGDGKLYDTVEFDFHFVQYVVINGDQI